ncbi:C4-dicarboxylate transport protein [Alsobacter metallidurans]|uniref:C4-dicarboxylate transport protein n=1 Tax=Alsobacter metallidurans TaxID=340221 RepID=A0A917MGU8_9HYPH|nr:dicarboxylate/amino acid:cation symporter [Alsobacter metallidurans]GGH12671.1 C4-dicarboxylate transport protein [Alsobacter metallidurans]
MAHALTAGAAPAPRKKFYQVLYVQVLIAVAVGILLGHFYPQVGEQMKPLGDAFIKLVKMIIAPVIFLTVVSGIAGMTNLEKVGRVGAKALLYFICFSTLALIVGLIVANVLHPGAGMHIDPKSLDTKAVATYAAKAHDQSIMGFLMNIIPDTVVGAFASGEILQVLFFSVLFGFGLAFMGDKGKPVLDFIKVAAEAVFGVVHIIMKVAPIGAFGAMAFTIGKYGIASIGNLFYLVAAFYLTSVIFVVGVLGLVARYNGFSVLKLVRYIKEELLLVLGTSSSESALPSLLEKMERAGCSKSVVGLVVPTGYSFNLDGTNIYMTMAALFIAQATDTPLTLTDQVLLLLVAMLSSKGAAGVTGSGFVTLAATLSVVPSVPVAGMALILGIDRFMSECRALTNFVGNAVACVVVARWEGECDMERLHAALDGNPMPLPSELETQAPVATPIAA